MYLSVKEMENPGGGEGGAWPCCRSPREQLRGPWSGEEEEGGHGKVKRLRDIPV